MEKPMKQRQILQESYIVIFYNRKIYRHDEFYIEILHKEDLVTNNFFTMYIIHQLG